MWVNKQFQSNNNLKALLFKNVFWVKNKSNDFIKFYVLLKKNITEYSKGQCFQVQHSFMLKTELSCVWLSDNESLRIIKKKELPFTPGTVCPKF